MAGTFSVRKLIEFAVLALPTMVSMASIFAISLMELSVMGHRGVTELAAISYAQMAMEFTTVLFVQGFIKGMGALCVQVAEAKNCYLLTHYGQLTAAMVTAACMPLAVLWWHVGSILLLAGVSEEVSVFSTVYCRLWVLGLWPRSMFEVLSVFYEAQRISVPTAVVNFVTAAVTLMLMTGLTYGRYGLPELGFTGCPMATVIAMWLRLIIYIIYLHCVRRNDHKRERMRRQGALNVHALKKLMSTALPYVCGQLLETMQLHIIALFSAKIGLEQLATHRLMMELILFAATPIHAVVNSSVAHARWYLEAGEADSARMVAQVAGVCIAALCIGNGCLLVVSKGHLGRIFSDDLAVIARFRDIEPLAAATCVVLGFLYYSKVVLRAQARSLPLAWGFAIGAWFVGVFCSYHLGLQADPPSFVGIWWGIVLHCVVTATISFYHAFFRVDWNAQARLAFKRSHANKKQQQETDPLLPVANA